MTLTAPTRFRAALRLSARPPPGALGDRPSIAGLDAVRRAGLPETYGSWNPTGADLFLWVYKLRRDLRSRDATVDFAAAALHARGVTHHERSRRQVREGSDRSRYAAPETPDPDGRRADESSLRLARTSRQ